MNTNLETIFDSLERKSVVKATSTFAVEGVASLLDNQTITIVFRIIILDNSLTDPILLRIVIDYRYTKFIECCLFECKATHRFDGLDTDDRM